MEIVELATGDRLSYRSFDGMMKVREGIIQGVELKDGKLIHLIKYFDSDEKEEIIPERIVKYTPRFVYDPERYPNEKFDYLYALIEKLMDKLSSLENYIENQLD